ncbi:MAG: hemin uptake protein HemP [Pseudomonadota bacterium]
MPETPPARDHGAPSAASVESTDAASPTLASSALLQGAKTVNIVHNGSVYRLQATRQGKLILTK